MRKLVWDSSFRRAFKKRARNNPLLETSILDTIALLIEEPFHPSLKTHKLRGTLEGLWACWVEYDCRIVFFFDPDPDEDEDAIVLVDIGTHNQVY